MANILGSAFSLSMNENLRTEDKQTCSIKANPLLMATMKVLLFGKCCPCSPSFMGPIRADKLKCITHHLIVLISTV